jgi:hypothetical protein
MNSLLRDTGWLRAIGSKVALAVIWATVMTGLAASPPLFARDNDRGDRGGRNVEHDRRDWHANDARNQRYRHVYKRPYVYAQPVYIPPPVYYEPRQSPGISLFFPLDLRQREDPRRR